MKHLKLNKLILIGASTGGPGHIRKILKSLPLGFNSTIVIAQHISCEYISTFSSHMKENSKIDVKIAEDGDKLENSTVYIASKICRVVEKKASLSFEVLSNKDIDYNPNIDELFISCSKFTSNVKILACILTGIGDDGAKGMLELSKLDATCISESEDSAVVYGMPMRAKEISQKVETKSLQEIIDTIKKFGE